MSRAYTYIRPLYQCGWASFFVSVVLFIILCILWVSNSTAKRSVLVYDTRLLFYPENSLFTTVIDQTYDVVASNVSSCMHDRVQDPRVANISFGAGKTLVTFQRYPISTQVKLNGLRPWARIFVYFDIVNALGWVFFASAMFQGWYLLGSTALRLLAPDADESLCIWEEVHLCRHVPAYTGPAFTYIPLHGSHFCRWVEYGITSSVEVVIIAISLQKTSADELALLFTAQLCLCMLGFVIESALEDIFGTCENDPRSHAAHDACIFNIIGRIFFVLAAAWVVHLIIWLSIFETFSQVASDSKACSGAQGIPGWVSAIILSQVVFFSLFGVVQTVQVLVLMNVLWHQGNTYNDGVRICYFYAELWYGILNVGSKFFLGVILMTNIFKTQAS